MFLQKSKELEYYEQLHSNILDNPDKMKKKKNPTNTNLPRLNHKEIEHPNRHIVTKKIETVIKNLPRKTITELSGFTNEFYQTNFIKLIQKLKRRVQFLTFSIRPVSPDQGAMRKSCFLCLSGVFR